MRRIASAAALALAASAGLVPMAGPAFAAGVSCGDTVSASATLTEDLNCSGGTIVVEGEGTVLDLDRHAISGAAVLVTGSDVTIRSGGIDGTAAGSGEVVFVAPGGRLRLTGVTLSGSADQTGVMVDYGAHADVDRSRVKDLRIGVDLFGSGPNSVTGSLLSGNGVGVHVDRSGNVIRGNAFHRNGVGVAIAGSSAASASVVENVFSRQGEAGVRVTGAPDPRISGVGGEIVRNWIVTGASAGVEVSAPEGSGALGLSIAGNVVALNGSTGAVRDGIRARGPAESLSGVTLSGNYAIANAGRGIDAPGVTDGGANTAFLNRVRPQCIGVVCR